MTDLKPRRPMSDLKPSPLDDVLDRVEARIAAPELSDGRKWISTVVAECKPHEVAQCMGDLLDRAEFAEEIARRGILERLVAALERTHWGSVTEETRTILAELEEVRRG